MVRQDMHFRLYGAGLLLILLGVSFTVSVKPLTKERTPAEQLAYKEQQAKLLKPSVQQTQAPPASDKGQQAVNLSPEQLRQKRLDFRLVHSYSLQTTLAYSSYETLSKSGEVSSNLIWEKEVKGKLADFKAAIPKSDQPVKQQLIQVLADYVITHGLTQEFRDYGVSQIKRVTFDKLAKDKAATFYHMGHAAKMYNYVLQLGYEGSPAEWEEYLLKRRAEILDLLVKTSPKDMLTVKDLYAYTIFNDVQGRDLVCELLVDSYKDALAVGYTDTMVEWVRVIGKREVPPSAPWYPVVDNFISTSLFRMLYNASANTKKSISLNVVYN